MHKGLIAFAFVLAILLAVAYLYLAPSHVEHHTPTTTTVVASSSTTQSTTTTIGKTLSYANCANFKVSSALPYAQASGVCRWVGGELGLWVKAGDSGLGEVEIVGANNKTYVNNNFTYNCTTFFKNVTLPAQNYTLRLITGPGGGTCGVALAKLNLSTTPPQVVYPYIYNGNFSNGEYTGWNLTGTGFGAAPMNISYANKNECYVGSKWSGYPNTYFATTYDCGLSTSPGNITSSFFRVNPKYPFLNFKIISPDDSLIYIEILKANYRSVTSGNASASVYVNSTPEIIAHFNTYNVSIGSNASSTFMNASIPMTTLTNKVVQIRVVASTLVQERFIAIGNFSLGALPIEQKGINPNIEQLNG
jgi:hypothetical protein